MAGLFALSDQLHGKILVRGESSLRTRLGMWRMLSGMNLVRNLLLRSPAFKKCSIANWRVQPMNRRVVLSS